MERPSTARAAAWLVLTVAMAITAVLAWHSLTDRDVWLHLRAGRDILAEGAVPDRNAYSFTAPEHPWTDHEWLFQVAIAATGPARDAPGAVDRWNALRLALALALVLVLVLGDGGLAALRGGRHPARSLLAGAAVLAALGTLWTRLILRPELVSYLLLAVVLRRAEAALAADGGTPPAAWPARLLDPRRPGGQAALAVVLWAQMHGFAAAAAGVWLLAAAAVLLAPLLRAPAVPGAAVPRRAAGLAAAGALLALLLLAATPNHVHGLAYPLRALAQFGPDRPRLEGIISELVPTLRTPDALGATLVVLQASLAWAVAWTAMQWGRLPLLRVLVFAVAAAGAFAGQRGLGPYAVAFVLLHTAPVRLRVPRVGRAAAPLTAAGLALLGLAAVGWGARVVDDAFYLREGVARRWGGGPTPAHAPVEAAAALAPLGTAPVVANVDAAGCLLALSDVRLAIDGRTEAYPPSAWRAYADLRAGGEAARARLARWRPAAVCLTVGGPFASLAAQLQDDPDWTLTHAGAAAGVWRPAAAGIPAADPAGRAARLRAEAARPDQRPARAADLDLAAAALLRLAGASGAARDALADAVARRPDHAIARHNLGNALLAAGEPAAALPHFRAALAVNGRLAGSALNAGVCAARLGRRDEALAAFERAVAIDPALFGAWANLGGLRAAAGDREGAVAAFERALALRPDDRALAARLRALRRTGAR